MHKPLVATHADAQNLGFCNAGIRRWFSRKTDVTFDQFRKEGVTVEWLRQQDDAMANRLADYVEEINGQR